jgi:hypothetical protein
MSEKLLWFARCHSLTPKVKILVDAFLASGVNGLLNQLTLMLSC